MKLRSALSERTIKSSPNRDFIFKFDDESNARKFKEFATNFLKSNNIKNIKVLHAQNQVVLVGWVLNKKIDYDVEHEVIEKASNMTGEQLAEPVYFTL